MIKPKIKASQMEILAGSIRNIQKALGPVVDMSEHIKDEVLLGSALNIVTNAKAFMERLKEYVLEDRITNE